MAFLSLRAFTALTLAAALATGCGAPLTGSDVAFEATGDVTVDGMDPYAATLVGRLHVDAEDHVTGVLAFTSGGLPIEVQGTASGGTIHFDALILGVSYAGGGDSYELQRLDLHIDRDGEGAVTAVSVDGTGTLQSLGGDLISTADMSLSLTGGPDRTPPQVEIAEAEGGLPVGPVDALHLRFTEPVDRAAVTSAIAAKAGDGSPIALTITADDGVAGLVTWATVEPAGAWPFDGSLAIAPAGKLADMSGNAWAQGATVLAPPAPAGTVGATSFEGGTAPAFRTPSGEASVQELPMPLTEDGTHALVVGEGGAWAQVAVPAGKSKLVLRVAYVAQGFGPPESVAEDLGWLISVAGPASRADDRRDMVGAMFTESAGNGLFSYLGPIRVIELDVQAFAGGTATLALRPFGVERSPVTLMGFLVVDWIDI